MQCDRSSLQGFGAYNLKKQSASEVGLETAAALESGVVSGSASVLALALVPSCPGADSASVSADIFLSVASSGVGELLPQPIMVVSNRVLMIYFNFLSFITIPLCLQSSSHLSYFHLISFPPFKQMSHRGRFSLTHFLRESMGTVLFDSFLSQGDDSFDLLSVLRD